MPSRAASTNRPAKEPTQASNRASAANAPSGPWPPNPFAPAPVSDRYGRKPVLLVGMVLYLLSTAGCSTAWLGGRC